MRPTCLSARKAKPAIVEMEKRPLKTIFSFKKFTQKGAISIPKPNRSVMGKWISSVLSTVGMTAPALTPKVGMNEKQTLSELTVEKDVMGW